MQMRSIIYERHNQWACLPDYSLLEQYTSFYKISLFMKMYLPSSFKLSYVRAEMNVYAFMKELDQKDY